MPSIRAIPHALKRWTAWRQLRRASMLADRRRAERRARAAWVVFALLVFLAMLFSLAWAVPEGA